MRHFASKLTLTALTLATSLSAAACSSGQDPASAEKTAKSFTDVGRSRQAFTSAEATLVDFEWDGQVITDWSGGAPDAIGAQVFYTVGSLNDMDSVGQLEKLVTTNVVTTPQPDGRYLVSYHAKLPVAWNLAHTRPSTFSFTLPRVGIWNSLVGFAQTYGTTCVDASAHDVNAGSLWYYFRPRTFGCSFAPADVVNVTAQVTLSSANTTGKYPEYHRVWQDDVLDAVVVFGKYQEGTTTPADPGIDGYGRFAEHVRTKLAGLATAPITTLPANAPSRPSADFPDVTIEATLPYAKKVRVHLLLVDNVTTQGPAFDARFAQLTPEADLVLYSGHAGLGTNVRSLLGKGSYTAGHHLLFFMNGCDTFAYVDGRLRETRAALNPDDPSGTKYLDMVTNAMPSYADAYSSEPVLLDALIDYTKPRTYQSIFADIDYRQVVVVSGEEDNEFTPGMPVGSVQPPPSSGDDAGTPPSTGNDAGPPAQDAGSIPPGSTPPGSTPPGSGTTPPASTNTPPPSATPSETSDPGCACTTAPGAPSNEGSAPLASLGVAAAAALVVARRRRAV
jgi:hypothetical protein